MSVSEEKLLAYLQTAEEQAVYHAYPRHIATRLKLAHRTVLRLLTQAMLRGEAVLHWEIGCPHCGRIQHYAPSLTEASDAFVCAVCSTAFTPHLDDEVLISFSAHPSLRPLSPAADQPDYRQRIAAEYKSTTGHELLTVRAFRDWAKDQPLTAESLEVRRMAVWFSDLAGSTALYARQGDARAFSLVREHFEPLFQVVEEAGGVVVKTLGDSVMAVFTTSEAALHGALAAQAALNAFNDARSLSEVECLRLKIGLHVGPAILVTLNDRLDYFGQTINIASRLTGQAHDSEIVYSQTVHADAGVARLLADYRVLEESAPLKGVAERVGIHRLVVQTRQGAGTE